MKKKKKGKFRIDHWCSHSAEPVYYISGNSIVECLDDLFYYFSTLFLLEALIKLIDRSSSQINK